MKTKELVPQQVLSIRVRKMQDLKGKRIGTGAPGSGTEIIALRILEAYGIGRTASAASTP